MKHKTSTVSVMRSYDYCHFEYILTVEHENEADVPKDIITASVQCAELVDRSVERYRASKSYNEELQRTAYERNRIKERLRSLREARSAGHILAADDAAFLRGVDTDPGFEAKLDGRKFDYNEWESDNYDGRDIWRPHMKVAVNPLKNGELPNA